MMKFIREKKVRFGDGFLDVDLYEMDDGQITAEKRAKKKHVTPPHIIAAYDRHSKNHLRQLVMHNFGAGDYYLTPTYADPQPTLRDALREIANYISRLKRLYTKHGIELRAIYVTEGGRPKNDGTSTRIHHHVVINGGVPREEVEAAWKGRPRKDQTIRRGFVNSRTIQPGRDERGCEAIGEYMAKSRTKNLGKGVRRWNATHNIKRPTETIVDNKMSRRATEAYITDGREYARTLQDAKTLKDAVRSEQWEDLRRLLEKRYDRELIDVISSVSPYTGRVYISARFRRKE